MMLYRFVRGSLYCTVISVFMAAAPWKSEAVTEPGLEEIITRALARARQAETAGEPQGYTYTKASRVEELDANGRVKERKEKVYQVVFRGGSSQSKLVEVNGRAPGPSEVKKQNE